MEAKSGLVKGLFYLAMSLLTIKPTLIPSKFDMAAKRHKNHKNKISHLIISIGYEIEI